MNEIILSFLGPYAGWVMALSLGLVLFSRRSIRKRHVVVLLTSTVLGFVAFFVLLVLGLVYWSGNAVLFQGVMFVVAAITIGCGSAIGFWLILKSVGLTADEEVVAPSTRSRRASK